MKTACLILGLCLAGGALAQQPQFNDAVRDYRQGRWSAAYGQMVALANDGHRDAARIALFMHQYGPLLYAAEWDATEDEVDHWTRVAGAWPRSGEPIRVASVRSDVPRPYRARMVPFIGRKAP